MRKLALSSQAGKSQWHLLVQSQRLNQRLPRKPQNILTTLRTQLSALDTWLIPQSKSHIQLKNKLHAGVNIIIKNPRTNPWETILTSFDMKIAPSLKLEAATTIKASPIRKSIIKNIRETKIKIKKSRPSKIRKKCTAWRRSRRNSRQNESSSKEPEVAKNGIMMMDQATQTIPRTKRVLARTRNKTKTKRNPNIESSLPRRIPTQWIMLQLRATKQAFQRPLRRPRARFRPKNKRAAQ